jgi:hypothetical protein
MQLIDAQRRGLDDTVDLVVRLFTRLFQNLAESFTTHRKGERKMNQKAQSFNENAEFLREDFTPSSELVARMKVTWPEFVEIFGDVPYGTEGERLTLLAEAAGISRSEAAYLSVGLYDGHSKRTEDEYGFKAAVVLMSAAFVTGPSTEGLVASTSYPASLVAEILRRMRQAGIWRNGSVPTDHWFQGEKWTPGFWSDTLVAEGFLVARQRHYGKWEYRTQEQEWGH